MNSPVANRSTFVTVVAWIFICLSGFSTLISILQNIMIQFMFSGADMQASMDASRQAEDIPFFARFMMENMRWLFLAVLFVCIGTLVSSIGLLKRKNWARIVFIAIMSLGIAWNIAGFFLQLTMMSSMPQMPPGGHDDFQSNFQMMYTIMMVVSGIMVAGFSVLFGWIIKRLVSREIKLEFQAAPE